MTVREWFDFLKNDDEIKYFAAIMSGEELHLVDDYYTIEDFTKNIIVIKNVRKNTIKLYRL